MNNHLLYQQHIQLLGDTITPVSAYLNLRDHYPNALLLESSDYHSQADSYSFICLSPMAGFEATGKAYTLNYPNTPEETHTAKTNHGVWAAFKNFTASFTATESTLPFNTAGLFGYSSFEATKYFEDIEFAEKRTDTKNNPDLKYQLFQFVIAFDHFKNSLYLIQYSTQPFNGNQDDLASIQSLLRVGRTAQFSFQTKGQESSTLTDEDFRVLVDKGIAHCKRGDVFQVVLSREFCQPYVGDDFNVYRSIRSVNPSPYLFYFDYGNFKIFGSSPESQLQVAKGRAYINPIAGTVKRTGNAAEDQRLAEALQLDPKENSEHIMLVDLARNDLSRSADDVKVEVHAEIQYFSHVIHMVSKVSGRILNDKSSLNIYADTFPAGTLSGAPKHRALQIIDKNEPVKRNFYGGAIGFFGFDGSVNHAIIIRSVLSKNNKLTYQAGAGVVIKSVREHELQEVNNKVAAMRKAIKKAEEI